MSVIQRITIKEKDGSLIKMYPDQTLKFWDVSRSKDGSGIWYYSMHISTVLDMLYQAGRENCEVKMSLYGGDKIALQQ